MVSRLNRSERRALLLGTVLVLAGATARVGLAPDEAAWAWRPADTVAAAGPLGEVREAVADSRRRAARIATPLAPDEKLDPNRASVVELQRLSGVGPSRARAIVERREEARFRWKEDLLDVSGVGPVTLRRLAPHLDLPDAPTGAGGGRRPDPGRRATAGAGRDDRPAGGASPAVRRGRIDLNRAGPAELEALPGVGPVLARRIVERRRRARFRSVDELLEVPGIGPARLADLRPRVRVR